MSGASAAATSSAPRAASRRPAGPDSVAGLPELAAAVAEGKFDVRARAVPRRDVEEAWTEPADTTDRVVPVP